MRMGSKLNLFLVLGNNGDFIYHNNEIISQIKGKVKSIISKFKMVLD